MISLLSSGSNAHGQLANTTLEDSHIFSPCSFTDCPPGALPAGVHDILQAVSGANHTLVLLEFSDQAGGSHIELWGCGDGTKRQLGPSYIEHAHPKGSTSVFRPIDLLMHQIGFAGYACRLVSAAWETTYVVLSCIGKGDVLISMGANDYGDLGIGDLKKGKQAERPLHVVNFGHILVDGLPLDPSSLNIECIAAGPHNVVVDLKVRLSDGSPRELKVGWGASRHGQIGHVVSHSGRAVPFLAAPQIIPLDALEEDRVVALGVGNQHTISLHTSGRVRGLGSNRKGQLRGIDTLRRATAVGCTWNGTYIVCADDESRILATGSHSKGQLGRMLSSTLNDRDMILAAVEFPFSSTSHKLMRFACGSEHVISLFSVDPPEGANTEVWGWGWNEHGNLGIGTTDDVTLPTRLWPQDTTEETRQRVVGIWAGCGTSWIAIK